MKKYSFEWFKCLLLHIISNLIPYYFVRFTWYRNLCYKYQCLIPMHLELLSEFNAEIFKCNNIEGFDVEAFYQVTHLNKR